MTTFFTKYPNVGSDIQTGTYANLPTPGIIGRFYLPTDGSALMEDTGTAWESFGPLFPLTKPVFADFTWLNQETATAATVQDSIVITAPVGKTSNAYLIKATPSTPYKVTALIQNLSTPPNNSAGSGAGLVLYNTIAQTPIVFVGLVKTIGAFGVYRQNSSFSYSSTSAEAYPNAGGYIFYQIEDNGTTRYFRYSLDGVNFVEIFNESRTAYITPNRIGFTMNCFNSQTDSKCVLVSWKEE